jgi:BMFP domain-containing protein YqiC
MQSQNKIFEDLSKVATSALGTFAGLGREVGTAAKNRVREMAGSADMISRDEFEAVKAMAANARAEVELLKAEIAAMKAAAAPAAAPKRKTAKA